MRVVVPNRVGGSWAGGRGRNIPSHNLWIIFYFWFMTMVITVHATTRSVSWRADLSGELLTDSQLWWDAFRHSDITKDNGLTSFLEIKSTLANKICGKLLSDFAVSLKAGPVKHEIKFTKMPTYIWIRFLIKILYKDNFKTNFAFWAHGE